MAKGFEFFERDLRLATASLEPAQINAALAKFARAELAKAISQGASPQYEKIVNGRSGAAEETVQAPGPIVYLFSNWPLVLEFVLNELKRRSPRRSGRFARSYIVIAGGRVVTDFRAIAPDAEVIVTNAQPYVRKEGQIIIHDARLAVNRRFGAAYRAEMRFLNIGAGIHPLIPYRLRRSGRRSDRQAGMPISYPAIIINPI